MNINWFTVIAQIFNFLLLVWLLKKFLYKPVLIAIDEREKNIVARLNEADAKKEKAIKEHDEFIDKNKQFDAEKQNMMDVAIAGAKVQNDKLFEDARIQIDAQHIKQQQAIVDMENNLKTNVTQKTQQAILNVSKKVLADLASVDFETLVVAFFIKKLQALNDEAAEQLKTSFKLSNKPLLVQSAFPIDELQQNEIKSAVENLLEIPTAIEFVQTPEIISGIELSTSGYKLAWSISAYMAALQQNLEADLQHIPEAAVDHGANNLAEPEKFKNGV